MKGFKFLFSGSFMAMLLLFFAFAMGRATFIENDFNSTTAKALIYNSWWFEALMALMVINFTGMIFTRHLYHKKNLNIMIIHLALVVIIIGAAITRYLGFEGMMHIRNGQTSNEFISSDTYLRTTLIDGDEKQEIAGKILLISGKENLYNNSVDLKGNNVSVEVERYIPNARRVLKSSDGGKGILSVVAAGVSGRKDYFIDENSTESLGWISLSFGDTTDSKNLQVFRDGDSLFLKSPYNVLHTDIKTGQQDTLPANKFSPLAFMKIYSMRGLNFVFKEYTEDGILSFEPAPNGAPQQFEVAALNLMVNDTQKQVMLEIGNSSIGHERQFKVDDVMFNIKLGPDILKLPFSIKLNAFQLDRYPGSSSPSSFASDITLIDQANGVERPYRIFMNNVLNYGGYRFFQSSYDRDEKGTVLSVNHDYWGTMVTYFGYFLLFATLLVSLFMRNNRFGWLQQQVKHIHEERKKMLAVITFLFMTIASPVLLSAQDHNHELVPVNKDHAKRFGQLLVQSKDGRITPVNTLANLVLVKFYKKSNYEDLNATQVFLGMSADGHLWQDVPLIKVYDEALQNLLGINGEYARFNDFLNERGEYKLSQQVNAAFGKDPSQRTKFDKELISTDERVNICYLTFNGSHLNIYPLPGHSENKWGTQNEYLEYTKSNGLTPDAPLFTDYVQSLHSALQSGDYRASDEALTAINDFQQENGKAILPSPTKVKTEVLYNQINIFKRLFPFYMMIGMVLLGVFLIQLLYPSVELKKVILIANWLVVLAFTLHTIGLGVRWYIGGHAPWSNGYESMIYIAWATVLAGFLFKSTSAATPAVTSILAGVTLLTAHMSWLNPEITNLVPVLKSYWLTIHVATITASYGFLALGAMLGFLNMILMILRNKNNVKRIMLTINELTFTIEMALMIGMILLVIGNFLGGIWANESWGRYWGWDPKETWSLITIIVYAFILHTRMIPQIKSTFSTNFLATIGFSSVLMTYFGVNYYLSGLHSYAQGDPVPVPTFVYYALIIIAIVSVLAAMNGFKDKVHLDKKKLVNSTM